MTTTTPLFTITAKKSLLDDLTLYEKVDKVILNKLINSSLLKKTFHNKYAEKVYHNEKEQLMAYASKMKYGKVKVTYNKNKNNKYGRSNPDKALGLFCIRREIRHTLCGDSMADIDVDNCHPVILNQLCENENIDHYELNKYVKNRDEYFTAGMNAYGCSREDIKVLFIIYCYGGGIKKWIHNREIDITKCSTEAVYNDTIIEIPIMKQFHDSMANIHMEIGKKNQELCSIVIKNKNDNNITEFNLWGTVCSFVLQEYECRMLEAMYNYLIKNNIVIKDLCVLCADGLMIDKKKYTPDLLYKLKDVIKTEIGFDVNLSQKEMNSGYLNILDDNIINTDNIEVNESFKKYIPFDLETDVGVAKFIIQSFPDKFIWIKDKKDSSGVMYSWTGKRWETGNLEFMRCISSGCIDKLHDIKQQIIDDKDVINAKMASAIDGVLSNAEKNFQIRTKQFKYMESTEPFLINETIKFDDNKDIIGFNNGVYDLIKHEFREIKYSDYLTMSCGYDYNPYYEPDKMENMLSLLKTIIPDEETLNLMLEVMSAGLTGRVIETFVLFNGKGRNGKGLLDEFLQLIYGDYCLIYANVSLLTEKQKTGGNPELATIDNKRIVIMKEPDDDEPLQNSTIKSITGGGNVSGRMLYSNKTKVELSLILIMECNVRPKFKSAPGDAEEDRVIDILFPNRFTTKEEEIDDISVFRGNSLYKTKEWKELHRDAFLQILINSYKNLQKNEHVLKIPALVAKRTMNYLNQSFPILELFNDYYVKTTDRKTPLKLKDVYEKLKNTDTFYNFTKEQKRKYNLKNFYAFFETHRTFRGDYVDKYGNMTNFLRGYKIMGNDAVEEEEENVSETIDTVILL